MSFSSRRTQAPRWIAFDPKRLEGDALKLHVDGNFTLHGMSFDQTCSLTRCGFGDAMVNKPEGEGQVLSLDLTDGRRWEFMFANNKWHMGSSTAQSFGIL